MSSSQNENLGPRMLAEVLKRLGIIPPAVRRATHPRLLQQTGDDIPEGIPALFAFSELHGDGDALEESVTMAFLRRYVGGLTELRLVAVACGLIYLSRPIIGPVLSSIWEQLSRDVDEFINRALLLNEPEPELEQDSEARSEAEPEPRTVSMTVAEFKDLSDSADAIQVRLEEYETRQARDEQEMADLRAELAALKDQRERQTLETIDESEAETTPGTTDAQAVLAAETEGKTWRAQAECLQVQLDVEQANYRSVFKKKEIFRQGGKKLKEELNDLQAQYNVLEDSRDSWEEKCEALGQGADVKAAKALRDQAASDNLHNERRIEALEKQLGFEKSNRKEAQQVARDLRESSRKLKDELKAATTAYENLQTSYDDLDKMHDAAEEASEEKGKEIADLKAKRDRLEAELKDLKERADELKAERTGAAETAAPEHKEDKSQQNEEAVFQPSENRNAEEDAPLQRTQSAPLWLPLPHHGDTFDPLYDVSDYGDDDSDGPADFPTIDPSPHRAPFKMSGSASTFAPILPHRQAYLASQQAADSSGSDSGSDSPLPTHAPAPKAAGPDKAKNPHVQKLNEEVKRLEWTRKSGLPDLVEDREVVIGPEDVLDGMYDRQVTQFLNFTPIRCARGSMWGALNDIPNPLENMSIPPTPSGSSFEDTRATSNGEPGTSKASVEGDQDEKNETVDQASEPAKTPQVPVEEHVPAFSPGEQPQEGTPDGQISDRQHSTTLPSEADTASDVDNEINQATGDNVDQPAPENTEESNEAPKNPTTQEISGPDSSAMSEAENGSGNEEDWSDEDEEDHEEEEDNDDGAPMLGNYKVTRGHANGQEDDGAPMLGSHKVTHGPKPAKSDAKTPTMSKYKVTRGHARAGSEAGPSKAKEESEADEGWTDIEDEQGKEDEMDKVCDHESDAVPMLGNYKVTRAPPSAKDGSCLPMLGDHEVTRPENPASNVSATPNAEPDTGDDRQPSSPPPAPEPDLPQQGVATPSAVPESQSPAREPSPATTSEPTRDARPATQRPSNLSPGSENAAQTHIETVGDAFADHVPEHGSKSLDDPVSADQSGAKTQAAPQPASSTPAAGAASPQPPTHAGSGKPTRAPPRGPPDFSKLPRPQPPPGAPTGPRGQAPRKRDLEPPDGNLGRAPPRGPPDFSNLPRPQPPPGAPTGPRGQAPQKLGLEPSDGNLGRAPPRGPPDFGSPPKPQPPPGAPTGPRGHTPRKPSLERSGGRFENSAGSGNEDTTPRVRLPASPSTPPYRGSPLRNEMGAAPLPKKDDGQGPVPSSTPNSPRAAAPGATSHLNLRNQAPSAERGDGQNGQVTRIPQPRSARGSRSSESANSSFQRWQERMAKEAAEEAKKKQMGN